MHELVSTMIIFGRGGGWIIYQTLKWVLVYPGLCLAVVLSLGSVSFVDCYWLCIWTVDPLVVFPLGVEVICPSRSSSSL